MPIRKYPLITDQIYHVYNRSASNQPLFINKFDYKRFLSLMCFYQNINPPCKYSSFKIKAIDIRTEILNQLSVQGNYWVDIIAYCLMPNHFHFILKQNQDNGISTFISNICNGYTKYSNIKYDKNGHILSGPFKAILIETVEQLVHVVRYAHLNPYTSFLVKTFENLENYPYSSLPEYLQLVNTNICQKEIVMANFSSIPDYRQFVFDQADYQRTLNINRHLMLDCR